MRLSYIGFQHSVIINGSCRMVEMQGSQRDALMWLLQMPRNPQPFLPPQPPHSYASYCIHQRHNDKQCGWDNGDNVKHDCACPAASRYLRYHLQYQSSYPSSSQWKDKPQNARTMAVATREHTNRLDYLRLCLHRTDLLCSSSLSLSLLPLRFRATPREKDAASA